MKENDIQNQILDYLALQKGIYFYRSNNTGLYDATKKIFRKRRAYCPNGIPDIIVIKNGLFIGIEVKKKGSYLSPDQRIFQKNVEAAGGVYVLARSIDDLKGLFE